MSFSAWAFLCWTGVNQAELIFKRHCDCVACAYQQPDWAVNACKRWNKSEFPGGLMGDNGGLIVMCSRTDLMWENWKEADDRDSICWEKAACCAAIHLLFLFSFSSSVCIFISLYFLKNFQFSCLKKKRFLILSSFFHSFFLYFNTFSVHFCICLQQSHH